MIPEAPKPPRERDVQDGETAGLLAWFIVPWLVGTLMFIVLARQS